MSSIQCTVCNEAGHHMRRCPTLAAPLQPGFYSPPAGHRPSGDDDDDESCRAEKALHPVLCINRRKCLKKTKHQNQHKQPSL